MLGEAEHRFDKTHNDAAPLSSTRWEVHPDSVRVVLPVKYLSEGERLCH